MVRPKPSSNSQNMKLTAREKARIMHEYGFDENDGYDYIQHIAPPRDPEQPQIFISCDSEELPLDLNDKTESTTIKTEVYTDSMSDTEESYKSCEETPIDLKSILSEMNTESNKNLQKYESHNVNDSNDIEMEGADDALLDVFHRSYNYDSSTEISQSSSNDRGPFQPNHDYFVTLEPNLKSDILDYIRGRDSSSESTDFSMYSQGYHDSDKPLDLTLDKAEIALARYETPDMYTDYIENLRLSDSCDSDYLQPTFPFELPSMRNTTTEVSNDKKSHKKAVKLERRKRREEKSSNRSEFNKELLRQKNMRKNNSDSKRINP